MFHKCISGERGIPGLAFDGEPGLVGPRGHRGQLGHRGYTGLRGPPGSCKTTGCGADDPTAEHTGNLDS